MIVGKNFGIFNVLFLFYYFCKEDEVQRNRSIHVHVHSFSRNSLTLICLCYTSQIRSRGGTSYIMYVACMCSTQLRNYEKL